MWVSKMEVLSSETISNLTANDLEPIINDLNQIVDKIINIEVLSEWIFGIASAMVVIMMVILISIFLAKISN